MIVRGLLAASVGVALFQGAAFAANNSASTGESANTAQTAQPLPQEIREKLQKDGFSNIKIEPGSFLVSAQDKSGSPVEMVIRPNSMIMITESGNKNGGTPGKTK